LIKAILDKLQDFNGTNKDLWDFTRWFINEYCTPCHECGGTGAIKGKECRSCDGIGVTDGQIN